jgi:hypothetical protein
MRLSFWDVCFSCVRSISAEKRLAPEKTLCRKIETRRRTARSSLSCAEVRRSSWSWEVSSRVLGLQRWMERHVWVLIAVVPARLVLHLRSLVGHSRIGAVHYGNTTRIARRHAMGSSIIRRRGLWGHGSTVIVRVVGLVVRRRRIDVAGIVTDRCKAFDWREQVRTSGSWMMMAFVAAFLPRVDAISWRGRSNCVIRAQEGAVVVALP